MAASAVQYDVASRSIPVLLLKTKSSPGDAYEELFLSTPASNDFVFKPRFLPVLEHRFKKEGLARIGELLQRRQIGRGEGCLYGGLVFTSQRAVEAFAEAVEQGRGDGGWPHLQDVPIYSVGPATTRALRAIRQQPPLKIFGEHTGNGESLSHFMLEHYGTWYETRSEKPPLLFAVGEQRRDIIPKTLMSSDLPPGRRIRVDELVVYGTGVMESFKRDLCQSLADTRASQMRWIVVFSPTGCDTMLAGLELLDETANGDSENMAKKEQSPTRARKTFVATIGPTTRDHLIRTFGFCPDVCAAEPSPQGIRTGILQFMKEWPVA